jgi:RNA polymerase sigma-70 factor (ECF subfamily)
MDKDILINKAKNNDKGAINELCETYYPLIYRFIYFRTKSKEDAENLTHEVFIKMINNLSFQSGSFSSWIYTIARNVVNDYYRWKKIRIQETNVLENDVSSKENLEETALSQEMFKTSVGKLPLLQQEVIILKYINDFTNKQIAEILKKSEGAVKLLHFRAISTLKKMVVIT